MGRNLPASLGGPSPLPIDQDVEASTPTDATGSRATDPAVARTAEAQPGPVTVPDLTGMSTSDARRVSRLVGLHLDMQESPAPDDLWGRVLSQDPPPAATMVAGDAITITFGGRPQVIVPELHGREESEAVAALHAVGLTPERRGTRRSDKVPEGHVLRTRPRSGTEVAVGSRVAYVIAAGPRMKAGHGRRERQRVRASRLPDGSFMSLPEG